MAALRIKNQWFKPGVEHSPAENAQAVAFNTWRIGVNLVKQMRSAGYDVDAGEPYFAVLREALVFLALVADRMAHARLDAEGRTTFTATLVHHVAGTLGENRTDLMGGDEAVARAERERLIDLFNLRAGEYADFPFDPGEPDFAFLRYFGSLLEPLMPEKDRRWVMDQIIAVEAPDAVALLRRAMDGVFSTEPRRARRAAMGGE
jgi:hypothetical protein